MINRELKSPEMIKKCRQEEQIHSNFIHQWEFMNGGDFGNIYACQPFSGIWVWSNDFYMKEMPAENLENYHYLKINYCFEGRCEVLLKDGRYVYMEAGDLSIDINQPQGTFASPAGRYEGLEIIFDLKVFEKQTLPSLLDYGIDILQISEKLSETNGSFLGRVSEEWDGIARKMADGLKKEDRELIEYRFWLLQLLFLIEKGHCKSVEKKYFLTKGQKNIAKSAETIVTCDLKKRYTVEKLARDFGVSPSSLKKYFELVYGLPISKYLRKKRMEYATELLIQTEKSIAEVAMEVGYGNQGKFGCVFKEYFGQSPLEYRRLHRNQKTRRKL